MFSKIVTWKSTGTLSDSISRLGEEIDRSDAIVIGAGAGMSVSSGFAYDGKRFDDNFADFRKEYGIQDMYSGGFYPFPSREVYWAWWSRMILLNRYDAPAGKPYSDLLRLAGNKDYFVLTTNVDHQFQKAGFDKKRLFYTQGDYGLWQCSRPCHDRTYDNHEAVIKMAEAQHDMRIPSSLIPRCPVCGAEMEMNLRTDETFVQDDGWYRAAESYSGFIESHRDSRILFLELGVGWNTPAIIRFPFWKMTAENPEAVYACINRQEASIPMEIEKQSICIDGDIGEVLRNLLWKSC